MIASGSTSGEGGGIGLNAMLCAISDRTVFTAGSIVESASLIN